MERGDVPITGDNSMFSLGSCVWRTHSLINGLWFEQEPCLRLLSSAAAEASENPS